MCSVGSDGMQSPPPCTMCATVHDDDVVIDMWADRDHVLAAVARDWRTLKHGAKWLRADPDILGTAKEAVLDVASSRKRVARASSKS